MIHALVSFLALAAQGPVHAGLHPAEADVFLELGDATGLLSSLDSVPVLRLLRDERLKGLFTELGQSPDRPLRELAQQGIEQVWPGAQHTEWLDGVRTISASIVAVGPRSDSVAPVALLAIVDLATPQQASSLHAFILDRVKEHDPMPADMPGVECLHLGAGAADDLWCVAAGPRLVVGGSCKPEDYQARAAGKLAALSGREDFQKRLAAFDKASGVPVFWFALARSLTDILATTQKAGEDQGELAFLRQIPSDFNPLGSARVARMQYLGERFVTEMISNETPGAGAENGAAAVKPVDPAWLEPVPAGSMIVYSSAFDGAAAGKKMRELLAKDEQGTAALAALEQKLGFGPERVLARLGPGMTAYAAPLSGLGLPETRVWIDCEDPAAFTKDFEALVAALGETQPGFQVKTKPYKVKKSGSDEKLEVPVTTLTLPPEMVQIPMISLSPSFSPVGKKLVFGLSSMDVKNELKRVYSGDGEPIVSGANVLGKLGFTLPADARSVFVMDWGKLLGSVVGMIKAFAGMAGPEAMPFDLNKLPPAELFTQYLTPTFHYSRGIAAGLYRRNEASFGPETWFGLLGSSALLRSRQGSSGQVTPVGESPASAGGGR